METESNNLSPEEIAILSFTNDGEFDVHQLNAETRSIGQRYLLTSKESYFWAVAVALVSERYEHVDSDSILYAYNRAAQDNIELLVRKYRSNHMGYNDEAPDRYIFENLLKSFLHHLDCNDLHLGEISKRTDQAYRSLVEKGLIEDPLEIAVGTMVVAALGFVPYGFTTKTRRGRVVYRKISAGYWTWERKRANREVVTKFNFRLAKLLSAFKKVIIEVSRENIDDVDE